jgi:hypothetical protein
MAVPQMLASVIGLSPYARSIHYQYTAMMIAPLMIAAIEGGRLLWRFKVMHVLLPIWLLGCAYMTNVAWSPSPIGDRYNVWARPNPRHDAMREAVKLVPDDASVAATYTLAAAPVAPRADLRLAEPVGPVVLGQRRRLPVARSVDHRLHRLDRTQVGEAQRPLVPADRAGRPVPGRVRRRRRAGGQTQERLAAARDRQEVLAERRVGYEALGDLADRNDHPIEDPGRHRLND